MKTESNMPPDSSSLTVLLMLVALCTLAPALGSADPHASDTRVATVSLVDLDLTTPEGLRVARERLYTMARHACGESGDSQELSQQPHFATCVDKTLAFALRQIDTAVAHTVTRAVNVSLADLDLATPQGMSAARDRLLTIARRICRELAHSGDLVYQPNFAACVDDTLAGALAQVNAIAASRPSQSARQGGP